MSVNPLLNYQPTRRCHGAPSPLRKGWYAVAQRTVYFGHQSVGAGILAGLRRLNEEFELALRVVQTQDPASVGVPAFVHFLAGDNRNYFSKNACLLRLLESRTRAKRPIVLLKYCYVDLRSRADSSTMFNAYRDTVESIQFDHPDVTVLHSTIPLRTFDSGLSARAARLFGRRTEWEAAVARHHYNELIRAEFGGREPLFDLARVEARRPDGSISSFMSSGKRIETAAPENTYDGGHLSSECELAAAEALLDTLAVVIEDQS